MIKLSYLGLLIVGLLQWGTVMYAGAQPDFSKWGGDKGGSKGGAGRDSKWRLSIDPCTKCYLIWGQGGLDFWLRGRQPHWLRPCMYVSQYIKVEFIHEDYNTLNYGRHKPYTGIDIVMIFLLFSKWYLY